ncbi:transposase-like protein [Prauserella sediminis]|uniref:Transposase-like protein n=1 Tax=Prauserella sediminis TaxID=577680 RepID=A0A839XTX7_9PSEU|nr:transposase-like protein [Prauserella sediminis]
MVVIMSKRYPREVREKAVRLVLERLDEFESPYAAARAIAPLVDVHHESLRVWVKKALEEGSQGLSTRVLVLRVACRGPTVHRDGRAGQRPQLQRSEHHGEVGTDPVGVRWKIDGARRSVLDIRKDCPTCHRSWYFESPRRRT